MTDQEIFDEWYSKSLGATNTPMLDFARYYHQKKEDERKDAEKNRLEGSGQDVILK